MDADGSNYNTTSSFLDERVSFEEWIRMFVFVDSFLAWIFRFLHFEVLGGNDDAVCGSLVACVEDGNITDYKIPDIDLLHGTLLSADDNHLFVAA